MDQRSLALQDEYEQRFAANAEYRNEVWKVLCSEFFSRYVHPNAAVLDLGAGWGEFSRNIAARKKYAMDLNPECGRRVQGYSEFIQQDCSVEWPLPEGTLDVVFTSNFFEHLPDKASVDTTLGHAFRCLKKSGLIICLGPNIRFLPGAYWDYWDHFIPITDTSLAEALKLQGFSVKEKISRFLPYTMSTGRNPPLAAVKAYLKLPFVWPLLGKQFLLIAEKP